jgi:hypothetical protein
VLVVWITQLIKEELIQGIEAKDEEKYFNDLVLTL